MFGKWEEGLKEALRRSGGTHTLEDVAKEIHEQRAEYWPSDHCAVVTTVCEYPQRKVLRIWLATGEGWALDRAAGIAADIARNLGCDGIEIEGRMGWARRLARHGFRVERVVLTKDVR